MSSVISIPVDVANPGQFFACCGLLELAGRLWPGATAYFGDREFIIRDAESGLETLLEEFQACDLFVPQDGPDSQEENADDEVRIDRMALGRPFELLLDWWSDKSLKTWAGSMDPVAIFRAMRAGLAIDNTDPLNDLKVVFDQPSTARRDTKPKKREPFYFDSRRGEHSRSLDIGFAPDAFRMESTACPAVESLAFVGLQRFRPAPALSPRTFDYWTWTAPLPPLLAAAVACGSLPAVAGRQFRFENAFRTDQRKHKGFLRASCLT